MNLLLPGQPCALDQWYPVNDGVMGGRSQSRMDIGETVGEATPLVFSGFVSLENNGGFASQRTRPQRCDFSNARGIRLMVRADGQRYKFILRTDPGFDGVAYQASFDTVMDRWQQTALDWEIFQPTFRGRIVPGHPPVDPSNIFQFGLMIAEKQAGPFRLELAILDPRPPSSKNSP
jgi:NADH dehydrogenase [ubiquinone] 1 alpha subcomplex assembly factor 1